MSPPLAPHPMSSVAVCVDGDGESTAATQAKTSTTSASAATTEAPPRKLFASPVAARDDSTSSDDVSERCGGEAAPPVVGADATPHRPRRLFVVSDERCGGNSFGDVLRALWQRSHLDDPFAPHNRRYLGNVETPCDAVDAAFAHNWSLKYSLCYHGDGDGDDDNGADTYAHIVEYARRAHGAGVVVLYRRNPFRRALSLKLAQQCGVWDCEQSASRGGAEQRRRQQQQFSIVHDAFARDLHGYIARLGRTVARLRRLANDVCVIAYEDLFSGALDARLDAVRALCTHFDWAVDAAAWQRVARLRSLQPAAKLTTDAWIAAHLDNYAQLRSEFGDAYDRDWSLDDYCRRALRLQGEEEGSA